MFSIFSPPSLLYISKENKKNWKNLQISSIFLLFYIKLTVVYYEPNSICIGVWLLPTPETSELVIATFDLRYNVGYIGVFA